MSYEDMNENRKTETSIKYHNYQGMEQTNNRRNLREESNNCGYEYEHVKSISKANSFSEMLLKVKEEEIKVYKEELNTVHTAQNELKHAFEIEKAEKDYLKYQLELQNEQLKKLQYEVGRNQNGANNYYNHQKQQF